MFKKRGRGSINFTMLLIDIREKKSKAKEKLNTITPPPPLTTKIENNRKYILMFFHFILQKFLSQNFKKTHAYRYGYLCFKKRGRGSINFTMLLIDIRGKNQKLKKS